MRIKSRRRARLSLAIVAFATSALLGGVALAAPAAASPIRFVGIVPWWTADLRLDVSGASTQPGAPVIDWFVNNGTNQRWVFQIPATPPGGVPIECINGTCAYEIINQNSGQCLTTDGVAGDQLYQWPCNGSGQQLWSTNLGNLSNATDTIQNTSSGQCVDVYGWDPFPGARIDAWPCNGGANQDFGFD